MIYIVTGFMRSGTSMLCACLEAGGIEFVKSKDRDQLAIEHSDEHYQVNPCGLYEPSPTEMRQPGWPRQYAGKGIKVVFPWLHALAVQQYRVVAILRDAEEIRQSYEGAFGVRIPLSQIETSISESLLTLKNRRDVELTTLHYRQVVLENPVAAFTLLRAAGWPIDPSPAAAVVDEKRYRFRRERLTVGL